VIRRAGRPYPPPPSRRARRVVGWAVLGVTLLGAALIVLESLGIVGETGTYQVMFVGASVTEGYYATEDDQAYPADTVDLLDQRGADVVPLVVARAGTGTADVLKWRLEGSPDAIVLQVATNDFGKGLSLQQYRANYGAILAGLRALAPKARLLCLGGWRASTEVNQAGVTGAQFDAMTASECGTARGHFVSLEGLFRNPANHGPQGRATFLGPGDWFHPNNQGHRAIANLVVQNLGPVPTS
jgi:acyl-CoA thioesterase I